MSASSLILRADGKWQTDNWRRVAADEVGKLAPAQLQSSLIAPLQALPVLAQGQQPLGVLLAPEAEPEAVKPWLPRLSLIAIEFPVFRDGRGYSLAALLRQRLGFRGELRAVGDVLVDQLFYLKRVGFDAFALRADQEPDTAVAALSTFSEVYQSAADQPLPLFRRRALAAATGGVLG
jgi:uncharacterized protein (DUF934 family)